MNHIWMLNRNQWISRLKLFMALSRTPHGLVDMATPVFAALVWLGEFPSIGVFLLGLLTVFAGYTAVYAINDIVDFAPDKIKVDQGVFENHPGDLDGVLVRHPLARGLLPLKSGIIWASAWSLIAIIGAYALNPVCMYIFIMAAGLEAAYCLLWKVSPARSLVSGAVKTSGAVAAIYAVDPAPSFLFVLVLFFFLFFWEIGGQNVPNDWTDKDLDAAFKARTIPVIFGESVSADIILHSVIATLILSMVVFYTSKTDFGGLHALLALGFGVYLLLHPAARLYRNGTGVNAMALFNKASYYPLGLLGIVLIKILF